MAENNCVEQPAARRRRAAGTSDRTKRRVDQRDAVGRSKLLQGLDSHAAREVAVDLGLRKTPDQGLAFCGDWHYFLSF